jgi:four helix bundle protein
MPESIENLEIWQMALEVAKKVYILTKERPKEELYGLTSQARRAATSIPTDIAEGVGRRAPAEAARFGQIALGSLYELDTLFFLAADLGYSSHSSVTTLREELTTLAKRASSFLRYQETQS